MRLLDGLAEALYPTRCAGCDLPGSLLCETCRDRLALIDPSGACPRCGAPYGSLVCTECWDLSFAFTEAACVGSLERPLSRMVTIFKDAGEVRMAALLAELLTPAVSHWAGWADALVAVPATRAAVRRRGFDHASMLTSALARELDLPMSLVLASTGAEDQRLLGKAGRRANAGSALATRDGVAVPRRVIVVDDVFTTGATLDAAAALLLEAGAAEVRVCAVARAW